MHEQHCHHCSCIAAAVYVTSQFTSSQAIALHCPGQPSVAALVHLSSNSYILSATALHLLHVVASLPVTAIHRGDPHAGH